MADLGSFTLAAHGTLTAGQVDTLKIGTQAAEDEWFEVLNRNGAGEIWFTVDGATDPDVAQAETYVVPAVAGESRIVKVPSDGRVEFRLKSSLATSWSVTRLDD